MAYKARCSKCGEDLRLTFEEAVAGTFQCPACGAKGAVPPQVAGDARTRAEAKAKAEAAKEAGRREKQAREKRQAENAERERAAWRRRAAIAAGQRVRNEEAPRQARAEGRSYHPPPTDVAAGQAAPSREGMTLCRVCGKEVAQEAMTCPHCGGAPTGLAAFSKASGAFGSAMLAIGCMCIVIILVIAVMAAASGAAP
jgi:predicted RNA-binding Zn-ribbon protein involved in translation (DUF1610 family)